MVEALNPVNCDFSEVGCQQIDSTVYRALTKIDEYRDKVQEFWNSVRERLEEIAYGPLDADELWRNLGNLPADMMYADAWDMELADAIQESYDEVVWRLDYLEAYFEKRSWSRNASIISRRCRSWERDTDRSIAKTAIISDLVESFMEHHEGNEARALEAVGDVRDNEEDLDFIFDELIADGVQKLTYVYNDLYLNTELNVEMIYDSYH